MENQNNEQDQVQEKQTIAIDTDAIAAKVTENLKNELTPQVEHKKFEDLDYDERDNDLNNRISQVESQSQYTNEIIKAQRKVPQLSETLLKDAPAHLKSEAQRIINENLGDLAIQNPSIVDSLDNRAKQMLVDSALYQAQRVVGTPSPSVEPVGEIPDGIEDKASYRQAAEFLKKMGVTDPERIKAASLRMREN